MSNIPETLIQQVVAILPPICIKADTVSDDASAPLNPPLEPAEVVASYDMDMIYARVVQMVGDLVYRYGKGEYNSAQEAIDNRLIGKNGTILSAVSDLQKITTPRDALRYKYKINDTVKTKEVTDNDLEIIAEFIARISDDKLRASVQNGTYKPPKKR